MKLRAYRAEVALQQPDPVKALLEWSGLKRSDRDELLSAAARVGGIMTGDVPERLCALFTRHTQQWNALLAARSPELNSVA